VRVVAATTWHLERAVADGKFCGDLLGRLNAVSIRLPPLRERREDIPLLTDHFVKKYSVHYNKPHAQLSEDTMRLLVDHDWPGNVRELEHLIKRIVILGDNATIRRDLSRSAAIAADRLAQAAGHPAVTSPQREPSAAPVDPTGHTGGDEVNYSLKDISRTAARKAERELIFKMLQQTRWNRKETAEILGISYKALLYKIKENGLDQGS